MPGLKKRYPTISASWPLGSPSALMDRLKYDARNPPAKGWEFVSHPGSLVISNGWLRGERSGIAPVPFRKARATHFLRESRISRSKTTSSAGAAGAAGGASFFMRLICLTIMKMMKARMRKLIATVMKLP